MGKPAARLGDMTAHGGAIVVGFPTVMIGGMPAARIGDMHVCPMLNPGTPPPPHVGGPVAMGSPTVLIGGVPAARMGDMATCAGPPDSIVMGCPTVMIGEAGSGSGSGGGAGAASAARAAQSSVAAAQFGSLEATEREPHWVEFEFVDAAGLPVSGVPYTFTDAQGNESQGTLHSTGRIRRNGLKQEGECKVVLRSVSGAVWSKDAAEVGEEVTLTAKTEGFEAGTSALIQVLKRDIKGADMVVAEIEAEVQSDKVEATWVYPYEEESLEGPAETGAPSAYSAPQFFFVVVVGPCKATSGLLRFQDYIEIELKDEEGRGVPNAEYILYLADGEVRRGKLDGSGSKKVERVPPLAWDVAFPGAAGVVEPSE